MLCLAGKPCGIDYEMKAYVGDTVEDKPHKRNSVRLAIRKVTERKKGRIPNRSMMFKKLVKKVN